MLHKNLLFFNISQPKSSNLSYILSNLYFFTLINSKHYIVELKQKHQAFDMLKVTFLLISHTCGVFLIFLLFIYIWIISKDLSDAFEFSFINTALIINYLYCMFAYLFHNIWHTHLLLCKSIYQKLCICWLLISAKLLHSKSKELKLE